MSFKQSKIYKITNDLNDKIYVGSTIYKYLSQRMNVHRMMAKAKSQRHSLLYNFMRDSGLEHFKIELLENYECDNREQLNQREQIWHKKLNPQLNEYNADAKNPVIHKVKYISLNLE